jgi:hypothetical protein
MKAPLTLQHPSGPLLHCLNRKKEKNRKYIPTFCQVEGSDQVREGETETMISDADYPVQISNNIYIVIYI